MTIRSIGARIVAYVAGACLVAIFVAIAVALPPEIREAFTVSQVVTLVLMLLATLAVLVGIARSSVQAGADGVQVLNGYRRHHVPWSQIRGIGFGRGSPWATLVLDDDRSIMMLAIQGSDGQRARDAVSQLRQDLAAHQG